MTGTAAWLAAHQGGWDELLFVLVPIALFGGLLAIANRRATRWEAERERRPRRRGVTVLVRVLPPEEHPIARQPRDDLVAEVLVDDGRFTARAGPFREYERTLEAGDDGEVTETIRYELAPMVWSWLLGPPYRMALRRRPRPGHTPWWSPPEAPDRRGSTALGTLCYLALVFGFIGTLLTQTITFAADEFDASKTDQGAVLSLVRIGVLGALVVTTLADRRGRRRVLLGCAAAGCSAGRPVRAGARPRVARRGPDLRAGGATAGGVLVGIVAAEEMPSGSRAFAFSLLAAAGAFGAGLCLLALPLADIEHRRLAARDGGVGAAAAPGAAGRPAPPREPSLRRRPRRGGDGRSRLALLAARRVGAAAGAVHRARPRSCSTSSSATRRGSRPGRSPCSASSPTPRAGSAW